MFSLLFRQLIRKTRRYFQLNRAAKITTIGLFSVILLFLSLGLFSFFLHAFRFLAQAAYVQNALFLYLSELFLGTVFLLIFASALITGVFGLFSQKNHFLIAVSPSYPYLPLLVFIRMFVTSLWPVLLLVLPALLALAQVFPFSFLPATLTLVTLGVFVAGSVLAALTLILAASRLLLFLRPTLLRRSTLAILTLVFAVSMSASVWQPIRSVHLNTLFQIDATEQTQSSIDPISQAFSRLPSHPLALSFLAVTQKNIPLLVQSLLTLLAYLALLCLPFFLLQKYYLAGWQRFQENHTLARNSRRPLEEALKQAVGPLSALNRKERVIFLRNTRSMTWFGFFCLIWLFQAGSLFILNHQLSEQPRTIPYIVIALHVAATIYFVNMFVLRFALPSFSMEQSLSWLLKSAPLDPRKVFFARAAFYAPLLTLLGLVFTLLQIFFSHSILPAQQALILLVVLVSSITVTLFGLALGAMFPHFETDDPELISTSLPGLAFIFTSLFYGGATAFLAREVLIWHSFTLLILWILLSGALASLCILLPTRSTQASEPPRH